MISERLQAEGYTSMGVRLLPSLDATLHYPLHKTSMDMHPLCGLVADHVFKCRKRAETLLK